ncbi:MAG: DctP family TRAP transporter solute-binding subunit [Pseudazoarcus pumilus]|nr:DctP family TRAP transporter solute-binding subunit [Pseudazoarcus pumilus]
MPLLLSMCFGAGLPSAWAEEPIIIRFSHVVAPDAPKGKAAEFFARRAQELTDGRVRVEVYANSSLYADREEMEALQLGAVQMLAPSLAKFSVLGATAFEVFDLPYIFEDRRALRAVTEGEIGERLLELLEERGIKGLAFWDNGFKSFSANTPIRSPADLAGKRMRIQSSRVIEEQMLALGAVPHMMAFSDVYEALRVGVVDGTENPHSNLYTQRMHEVQPYLALTEHGYLGYAVIVNKRFWDNLPRGVRRQLERAMREATHYANQIAREENMTALAAIRAAGTTEVYELSAEEREAFRRALLPVHRSAAGRIGEELLRDIYRATGFRGSDG